MVDVFDYGGLPGRERNLDPKSRSLGVIFNFLGLLPYARAGAEAVARGESFWGGTPQYERQRQALQQYYNEAYESAPDSVKVLSFTGLPFGAASTVMNALAPLGRPGIAGAAIGAGMGATPRGILRRGSRTPATPGRASRTPCWAPRLVGFSAWAPRKARNMRMPC